MPEKKARPRSQRVYGKDFVEAASRLGLNLTDTRRVWKQVIQHLKGDPTRNTEDALADYATYGQLQDLRDADSRPVKGLNDPLWELFKTVAQEFVAEL